MENYLLFFIVACITILSPGPGVILTLSNAIRFGVSGSIMGIIGIAVGTFIVAAISATSLGVILATSTIAFTIMKFIGAAYLIYLGIKLWNAPTNKIQLDDSKHTLPWQRQFFEGLILQVTNPKAVFFFMSIFPQFVNYSNENPAHQFITLVITYSLLVMAIHITYAYLARSARRWLSSDTGGRTVNRVGGGTFMLFGVGLATTQK
ncbi:MAG: LysE family translocator [Arenicella sp.]